MDDLVIPCTAVVYFLNSYRISATAPIVYIFSDLGNIAFQARITKNIGYGRVSNGMPTNKSHVL